MNLEQLLGEGIFGTTTTVTIPDLTQYDIKAIFRIVSSKTKMVKMGEFKTTSKQDAEALKYMAKNPDSWHTERSALVKQILLKK